MVSMVSKEYSEMMRGRINEERENELWKVQIERQTWFSAPPLTTNKHDCTSTLRLTSNITMAHTSLTTKTVWNV